VGKRGAPQCLDQVSAVAEVIVVEVTVRRSAEPRRSPLRIAGAGRAARRRGVAALTLVLTIAVVATVWLGNRDPRGRPVNAMARNRGETGVAAAYGYPLRCLSVSILAADPTYARADFNHGRACGRYTGYPTAIFHYRSGMWRPVLDAVAYACPADSLPTVVQTELGVCE
jgi:hypothetical protein